MLSPRAIVPLALYLGGAHAYIDLSGSAPAKPTLASMKALGVSIPEPTSPPKPSGLVEKRAQGANTCGYVEGESGNAVTCEADGSECLYESDASAVGCCATTNCDIWTACIDSTDSDIWSTADAERTRYCSESSAPYCAVYGYLDDVWDGYTMILCDSTPTTYDFYYTPEGADEDDATSFVLDNTASESGSKTTGGKGSEETGDAGDNGGDDDDDDGGAPVGAIVGGTIGGVAALGLVGLAAFLLLRRRKSKDTPPAQPPMAAGQYQNQPPMAGGQYPNQPPPGVAGDPNQMYSGVPSMYMPPPGAPGGPPPGQPGLAPPGVAGGYYGPQHDQSMAKAPLSPMSTSPSQFTPTDPSQYNSSVAAGTPGAPPQSTSPPAGAAHTPPPPVYAAAYAQPGQQQQQQQQQTQNGAVELPTGRPDGELRELA